MQPTRRENDGHDETGMDKKNPRFDYVVPRLVSQHNGKTDRSWHGLFHFFHWLAHRTWRHKSTALQRLSNKSPKRLADSGDFPNPVIVSRDPDNSEENQDVAARDIIGRRETRDRFRQGGVDTMPYLHLGVRLGDSDAPTRKDIERVLNGAKTWYRYTPNCWLIYTGKDVETWGKRIQEIPGMEENTSFFLCEVRIDKRYGWLSESAWQWINKNRT